MLEIIKNILQLIIYDIDSKNSNLSESEQMEVILLCQKLNLKLLSKVEAYDYLGVSRATFDNYVKKGFIPKGSKRP